MLSSFGMPGQVSSPVKVGGSTSESLQKRREGTLISPLHNTCSFLTYNFSAARRAAAATSATSQPHPAITTTTPSEPFKALSVAPPTPSGDIHGANGTSHPSTPSSSPRVEDKLSRVGQVNGTPTSATFPVQSNGVRANGVGEPL